MSETSSSMHRKSGEQKPRRTPRRMKAAIRCRLEDDAVGGLRGIADQFEQAYLLNF